MEFILLDWTRMGPLYCIAGVVFQAGGWRIVRPQHVRCRGVASGKLGWPATSLDGRSRWEVFDLLAPEPGQVAAPHTEDVWVRGLRSRGQPAPPELRRTILEATLVPAGQPLFGAPLVTSRATAYLTPGTGARSLTSLRVRSDQIGFSSSLREGADAADVRALIDHPALAGCFLPVKDHHLLRDAERAGRTPESLDDALGARVAGLGPEVVIRLGLSRPHSGRCWLMADGFFSWTDPQP